MMNFFAREEAAVEEMSISASPPIERPKSMSTSRIRKVGAMVFFLCFLLCQTAQAKRPIPNFSAIKKAFAWPHRRNKFSPVLDLRGGAAKKSKNKRMVTSTTKSKSTMTTGSNKSTFSRKQPDQQQHEDPEHKRLLLLIKVLFLSYYASLGSLMPYLPVYYHSLGHGGLIIGMLGAVKPLTTFIVAPFWGILSDRSTDKFVILKTTFIVSLIGQLLVAMRHDVYFLTAMTLVTAFMNAPVKSLIDSMVMDHLSEQDKSSYGKLRLYGQLGFGLGSSGVGMLLHRSSGDSFDMPAMAPSKDTVQFIVSWIHRHALHLWNNLTGYKLLFSTYAALSIPTWLCLKAFQRMDQEKAARALQGKSRSKTAAVKTNKEGAKIKQGLSLLFHNSDALLFFFLVFVVGVSSGIIENFAYVRMREVGGSGKEMGLSRLVSSAFGAPMFWFSGPLTEKLGADRVLVFSLMSYVARFLIYAFMRNPYQGLPAEALRGLTFAAFWSTGTIYAHRISPHGMHATMLMFLNAMYGGLGQSLGALIGGRMQHKFGTVQTFLYAASFDVCFIAFVIFCLRVRKDSSFRNPQPIEPKPNGKTNAIVEKLGGKKEAVEGSPKKTKKQPAR